MKNVRHMTLTALFMALVFLLGLTPVGLIPLGFITVTVLQTPVVLGTILLGLKSGLLLGLCFGITSLMSLLGLSPMVPPSALGQIVLAGDPFLAVMMCILPRLLVPAAAWGMYRLLARGRENCVRAVPVAAAVGSLVNTVGYLGIMMLAFVAIGQENEFLREKYMLFFDAGAAGSFIQNFWDYLKDPAVGLPALVGGVALVAGTLEAVLAAVVAPAVAAAIWKTQKTDKGARA